MNISSNFITDERGKIVLQLDSSNYAKKKAENYASQLTRTGKFDSESGRIALNEIIKSVAQEGGVALPFDVGYPVISFPPPSLFNEIAADPGLIDSLFESIVPLESRKKRGQFLTPPDIARFMSAWGMMKPCKKILDPAVGPGIFLQSISTDTNVMMVGVDIDPLALNAAYLRCSLLGRSKELTLINKDFILDDIKNGFDLIIGNPPYLKFHDYDRDATVDRLSEKLKIKISKLSNIYSLFFLQSHTLLNNGGRLAFITPSEYLYTGYGKTVKRFFLEHFTIEAIILTHFDELAFNDVLTTSAITLLSKKEPPEGHQAKFITVKKWPGSKALLDCVVNNGVCPPDCTMSMVSQAALKPDEKWQSHFCDNGTKQYHDKLVPLSKYASIKRGIATGANKFFTLTKEEKERWGIEEKFLKPVICRSVNVPHFDLTEEDYKNQESKGDKAYLLYIETEPSPNLLKYLEYGVAQGVNKRYLPSHRKPWYSSEKQVPPDMMACVFSRDKMRFIENKANLRTLTTFHCIYTKGLDEKMSKALLAYLNSPFSLKIQEHMRREYGGGLHKFEPNDLDNLLVLDLERMSSDIIDELANLFEELCRSSRKGRPLEATLRRIEEVVQRGIDDMDAVKVEKNEEVKKVGKRPYQASLW